MLTLMTQIILKRVLFSLFVSKVLDSFDSDVEIIKTPYTILDDNPISNTDEVPVSSEEMRNKYFNMFIEEKPAMEEESKQLNLFHSPKHCRTEEVGVSSKKFDKMFTEEAMKKKLKKLERNVLQINDSLEEAKRNTDSQYQIKNLELLEKVTPIFLEYIALNWQEVTQALIDDLLIELVRILYSFSN